MSSITYDFSIQVDTVSMPYYMDKKEEFNQWINEMEKYCKSIAGMLAGLRCLVNEAGQ